MFTRKAVFSQNNGGKSYTERKKNMSLQIGQCLQNVHLMQKKTNVIVI